MQKNTPGFTNRIIVVLRTTLILLLVLSSLQFYPWPADSEANAGSTFIVQAENASQAALAVERVGGQVIRELSVIQSVTAILSTDQKSTLEKTQGIKRVWMDATVSANDSADPGTLYAPISGGEARKGSLDPVRVSSCDGTRDNMDSIPLNALDENSYQSYQFSPAVNPSSLPSTLKLRFVFKEKSLNQAQLRVYQTSTNTWFPFNINTTQTNDAVIDTSIDISFLKANPQDISQLLVRFYVSRNEGGEKAEVDCSNLSFYNAYNRLLGTYKPSSSMETTIGSFDLARVTALDGNWDNLDPIPLGDISPSGFQIYTFSPVVDPANLPGLVDLHFVFKEKSLNHAEVRVYQKTTRQWISFDLNTLATDDEVIDTTLDLSEIVETPEDFSNLAVAFYASHDVGGEKAEVDFVSLRLAQLVGELTSMDATQSFIATNAEPVWSQNNLGAGVGVAVIDTGVKNYKEIKKNSMDQDTGLLSGWDALTGKNDGKHDQNGHGTLVASIIKNSKKNANGRFYGVAPDATIIPVRVLGEDGSGSYSNVIAGIQWVLDHKAQYNIRVINLSLSTSPQSYYWDDPLNQALMRAWQAGIVVVAAAGNNGPNPMSIGVPGNNPYVITVGAITDAYTPQQWSDDYVPAFSAAGPTVEGFVKPDLVAPGGHVLGVMSDKGRLAKDHPEYREDKDYYQLSGTSMSAAQVSGVVALMLAKNPGLTPDQIKYRLMANAKPALDSNGNLSFSIFQQGAGRVRRVCCSQQQSIRECQSGFKHHE